MANPFYERLGGKAPANPMIQQFLQFKKSFNGNPQQIVQKIIIDWGGLKTSYLGPR